MPRVGGGCHLVLRIVEAYLLDLAFQRFSRYCGSVRVRGGPTKFVFSAI